VLEDLAEGMAEPWRDPAGVRELAGQVSALATHLTGRLEGPAGEKAPTRPVRRWRRARRTAAGNASAGEVPGGLLRLRLQAVYLLNTLGDSSGLAILAAEPLVADCERLLGTDHPNTLGSRGNLAAAYQAAGRTAEAIALH